MKTCSKCIETKELNLFYSNKASKDGVYSVCKLCVSKRHSKWYTANKHVKSVRNTEWRKNNLAKVASYSSKQRADKFKATPKWADLKAIDVEYELARWCTEATGTEYHVDHIVPLKGKNVCGLHVHYNLQVITGLDNRRKNNKYA